ncbi:hypothetical protein MG293_000595 [Ovis ammon polii]|uniref:Uncharacterized protein n=1 Tax=Ovis ammon polii TaxID=230172 RepID=A0AAD4UQ15_OVIAM|nr:hypothetical protein MG293_000595 [Ovis ammon polii]
MLAGELFSRNPESAEASLELNWLKLDRITDPPIGMDLSLKLKIKETGLPVAFNLSVQTLDIELTWNSGYEYSRHKKKYGCESICHIELHIALWMNLAFKALCHLAPAFCSATPLHTDILCLNNLESQGGTLKGATKEGGSLRGRKEVRAKSSDWLPGFGNLKRARIFRPTSIELPSTRKGPKWRAKIGGWEESLDGGGGEMC